MRISKMKKRKVFGSYEQAEEFLRDYEEQGGVIIQMNEGSLLIGDWLCIDATNTLKCYVISECFVSTQSSEMVITSEYNGWNKTPKKWKKVLEESQYLIDAEDAENAEEVIKAYISATSKIVKHIINEMYAWKWDLDFEKPNLE